MSFYSLIMAQVSIYDCYGEQRSLRLSGAEERPFPQHVVEQFLELHFHDLFMSPQILILGYGGQRSTGLLQCTSKARAPARNPR